MAMEEGERGWSEMLLLPPNVTWTQLRSGESTQKEFWRELTHPIVLALIIILIRFLIERFLLYNLGMWLYFGKPPRRPWPSNVHLEKYYRGHVRLSPWIKSGDLADLAKQLDTTTKQVEVWIRRRQQCDRHIGMDDFTEASLHLLYYSGLFVFGVTLLWSEPWLWSSEHFWLSYPHVPVDKNTWWYFMVQLGLYVALCILQVCGDTHKDYCRTLPHKILTIVFVGLAWKCNFVRVASVILLARDASQAIFELTKLTKHLNCAKLGRVLVPVLGVVWTATRIGLFAGWIMYSALQEAPAILGLGPAYYTFNGLLAALFVMHLVSTKEVFMMAKEILSYFQWLEDDPVEDSPTGHADESKLKRP